METITGTNTELIFKHFLTAYAVRRSARLSGIYGSNTPGSRKLSKRFLFIRDERQARRFEATLNRRISVAL